MNDRYLFQGKRLDNGECVVGFYAICRRHHYIIPLASDSYLFGTDDRYIEWVEVDPSTVGQCNDKWISVKDRLPEAERKKFRGEYKDDELEVNCMLKGAKIATTLCYDGTGFTDSSREYYTVTHWMPLPEPPGEEDI